MCFSVKSVVLLLLVRNCESNIRVVGVRSSLLVASGIFGRVPDVPYKAVEWRGAVGWRWSGNASLGGGGGAERYGSG